MNLSLKSTDESLQQPENNISNETVPLLAAPNEKENERNHNRQRKSSWTSTKDLPNIKTEVITPVRSNSVSSSSFRNFISAKIQTT
jgi:hypothetical protein